ncbi:MAG TPA: hypothetical protein PKW94_01065 [Candidatus Dojkabacteria bacterium]|nr:hypothetical protein [Candidatus Dojkabacteria bacterium]HOR06111.1 hypothetical protein [Candidatus Dojkabacteria bacterium]HOT60879.1 hypothetical protein [Candidatus Dojkabacteria bacterium]HQI92671.1 hypothetical protein [Candidatus Dojkabacteria bacterium]
MNKKTKTILIISFSLLFVGVCVGVYFLLTIPPKTYPKDPIEQTSLYTTSQEINFYSEDLESKDYPLYGVSSEVMLKEVEAFVSTIAPQLKKISNDEGAYYEWGFKEDSVTYNLTQNALMFSFANGIPWDEADISAYTFKNFMRKFFAQDWEYKLSQNEIMPNGKEIYYANRTIGENKIETNEYRLETDYLIFQGSKIVGGKLLLTHFTDTGITLPLLGAKDLKKYINLDNYPKEIYPNFSSIDANVLNEIDYLSDEFESLINTLNNCSSGSVETVYLYKNFKQESLTPVYKIDLQCEITYKETKYTIPATGYVNAVDPKYISALK